MTKLKEKASFYIPLTSSSTLKIILVVLFSGILFQAASGSERNNTEEADGESRNVTAVGEGQTCSKEDSKCCNSTSGNNAEGCNLSTKLLLVQMIFRHGDRTPLFSYPTDPHKNASGIPMLKSKRRGLLTKRGKVQAYELGTFVASRYSEYLDGLWIPEDIHAQSSISERAIMTAQTCLAGMFVPYCVDGPQQIEGTGLGCEKRWSREIKWQPIPVYPIPEDSDNKLRFLSEKCPAYVAELDKILECSPMQEYMEKHKEVFSYVQNHSGLAKVDFKNLGRVYDTLFIQNTYDLELPEWTKKVFPEPMKSIEEFGFQVLSGTTKMIRLNGGPLLRQIIFNMKQRIGEIIKSKCTKKKSKKQRSKRLYLFSGHDTTLSAFLSALNVFQIHQPPYASAVFIELHQVVGTIDGENQNEEQGGKVNTGRGRNDVTMKDMVVKVFYRNSTKDPPHELIIPACGNPCYFEKLETEMRDLMISDAEWFKECNVDSLWFLKPFTYILSLIWSLFNKIWSFFFCGCGD